MRTLIFTLGTYLLLGACIPACSQSGLQRQIPYGPIPADLANALAQMARSSHVPIVAELAQPLPMVPMAEGTPVSENSLNELVKQAPGYEWEMDGRVVHFYNKKLRVAPFNFLNLRFSRFTVPPNLSELKLWFPGRAIGLLEGFTAEGGAISGFGDAELEKQKLERTTLENITPLEVLLHVANQSPSFYAIIVFPNPAPSRRQVEQQVHWFWGSLNEKLAPLYVQPVGPAGGPHTSR